jgi:hypothetical protein
MFLKKHSNPIRFLLIIIIGIFNVCLCTWLHLSLTFNYFLLTNNNSFMHSFFYSLINYACTIRFTSQMIWCTVITTRLNMRWSTQFLEKKFLNFIHIKLNLLYHYLNSPHFCLSLISSLLIIMKNCSFFLTSLHHIP